MSPSSLPRHTSAACHALHAKRSIVGNGMSLGACVCAVVPLNHGLSKTDPKLTWHRHTWPWQNYIRIRNIGKGDSCRHILTWIPSWGPAVGQWVVKLLDPMYRLHSNFTYQQPTKPTRYSSPKTKTLRLRPCFCSFLFWSSLSGYVTIENRKTIYKLPSRALRRGDGDRTFRFIKLEWRLTSSDLRCAWGRGLVFAPFPQPWKYHRRHHSATQTWWS